MSYNEDLAELAKRFDDLKDTLASRKGALSSAVDRLAKEHGVDNSTDAKASMDDLNGKIKGWQDELTNLINTIDTALSQAESGEVDDDFDE